MKKALFALVFIVGYYCSHAQTNTFPSTGNVGIGTTSPVKLFTIQGDSAVLRLQSPSNPTGYFTDLVNKYSIVSPFYVHTPSYGRFGYKKLGLVTPTDVAVAYVNGCFGLAFVTGTRGEDPSPLDVRMSILGNGNVGIGTTAPRQLLDIVGNNVSNNFMYLSNTGTYGSLLKIGTVITNSRQESQIQYQSIFGIYDVNGGSNSRLFIDPNGNIGIGRISLNAKLDIMNTLSGVHSNTPSLFRTIDAYNAGANQQFFQVLGAGDGTNSTNINLISNWGYLSLGARADGNATPTNTLNILSNGNIGIGTTNPQGYMLAVNGSVIATSMTVKLNANWPDYVFKVDYHLPTLQEVKTYINQNHHLPEVPSEQEVAKNGLNLGEMNKILTKKVEELTLYLIEKDKQLNDQRSINKTLDERLKRLEEEVLYKKKDSQ